MANNLRIYVDGSTGSDLNGGTSYGDALLTIGAALTIQGTGNGNWIYFRNVTHTTTLAITQAGILGNKNKLIQDDTTSLISVAASNGVNVTAAYYECENLIVSACGATGITFTGGAYASRPVFRNCTSKSNTGSGIAIGAIGNAAHIYDCTTRYNTVAGYSVCSLLELSDQQDNLSVGNNGSGFELDRVASVGSGLFSGNVSTNSGVLTNTSGINNYRPTASLVIDACTVIGTFNTDRGGIRIQHASASYTTTIQNSYIMGNNAGIYLEDFSGASQLLTVNNCVFAFNNKAAWIVSGAAPIGFNSCDFEGNSICFYLRAGTAGQSIYTVTNSIFANNTCIFYNAALTNNTGVLTNCLLKDYQIKYYATAAFSYAENSCSTGNPYFVNPSVEYKDFRIKSTSAAIGIGTGGTDAGAFAYTATVTPVITSHATSTVYTDTVTLAGTAAAGDYVDVSIGGTLVGSALITANAWSIEIPLAAGANVITAVARDEDIGSSTAATITLTAAAPSAPAISTETATLYTDVATIAGTITAAQGTVSVEVLIGGVLTASATPSGTAWSVQVPITSGANVITARSINEVGTSAASGSVTLTASAPSAPAITTAPATVYTDTATITGTITGSQGTVSVEVLVGGAVVASATPSGTAWSVPIELTLGANVVTARAFNEVGTSSASSSVTLTAAAPTAPVISTATATVYSATQTITGTITASEGTTYVALYVGGVAAGGAVPSGTSWSAVLTVSAGANVITAKSGNEVGLSAASTSITLTLSGTVAPVIVTPSTSTVTVSTQLITGTCVNTANRVNIYIGGVLSAIAAQSGGTFSDYITLGAGANAVTAKTVSDAGDLSDASNTVTLTYSTSSSMDAAMYGRLTGYLALSALVGTRVYAILGPQEPTLPFVVYQSEESEAVSTMGSDGTLRAETYSIACYGSTLVSAKNVAAAATAALRRWSGTQSGMTINDSFIEPDSEDGQDVETENWVVTFRAKVWYQA